jgi:hypothetical protein
MLNVLSCIRVTRDKKWRVLNWMIGFIGTSVTISANYNQYRAITDLHNLQFTVAHTLGLSVFTSRLLAVDLNRETSTSKHYEVSCCFFFNHFVLLCPNLRSTDLHSSLRTCSTLILVPSATQNWTCSTNCLQDNFSAQTPQKTLSSVVKDACLQLCCLAIDVLLFHAFASAGTCLPTHCL